MANSSVKESKAMELNEAPTPIAQQQQQKKWKTCLECGTSKTPLWRSGPAGPKTLCNACGIRSRKKKPDDDLGPNKKGKKIRINDDNDDGSSSSGESLKETLTRLVREVMTEMPLLERTWNMLGEEEQAALVLMSLSASDRF